MRRLPRSDRREGPMDRLVSPQPAEGFPFGREPSAGPLSGSYWPYATDAVRNINRAMPLHQPGSLPRTRCTACRRGSERERDRRALTRSWNATRCRRCTCPRAPGSWTTPTGRPEIRRHVRTARWRSALSDLRRASSVAYSPLPRRRRRDRETVDAFVATDAMGRLLVF